MSVITIDKNVPFPGRALRSTYPFKDMKVGDSFFVPDRQTIFVRSAEKGLGFTFRARRVDGGVRVWRVA